MSKELWNTLRKFNYKDRSHVNCFRFGKNENPEHIKLKFKTCLEYFNEGFNFLTEAKLLDQSFIADVVILELNKIIEIKVSETDKSISRKQKIAQSMGLEFCVKSAQKT